MIGLVLLSGCTTGAEVQPASSVTDLTAMIEPTSQPMSWVEDWLNRLRAGTVEDPPEQIVRYDEPDGSLYLVTYGCCDRFSDLYDDEGMLLGHPDGGITGRGDGSTSFDPSAPGVVIWPED